MGYYFFSEAAPQSDAKNNIFYIYEKLKNIAQKNPTAVAIGEKLCYTSIKSNP